MKPALSLITLAMLASPAFANNELSTQAIEVIEVTSNFKQENLMKAQGSISVIDSDEIITRNALHSESLLGAMANVNFSSGASRGNFVQIRGIGQRSEFVDPTNPSVGLIIDGINYSGLGGAGLLFDVNQVALYRGPQGTVFGNDAIAGVLKLDSAPAGENQDSRLLISAGTFNSASAGFAAGANLSDDVALRLSAVKQVSDGYINNLFLDAKDTNNIDESNVKLKVTAQATEHLSIDAVMHYIDNDNGYDAFSLDLNRDTYSDQPGRDAQRTKAFGITSIYDGFDSVNIELIASSLSSDLVYSYDEDWAYGQYSWLSDDPTYQPDPCDTVLGPCLAEADGYSATDEYLRTREQNSVDLRLLSKENNEFSWVAGIYVNQRDSDLTRKYTWQSQDFVSANEHKDSAIYGQFGYQLSAKSELTVGARIGQYDIDYSDNAMISEVADDTLYGFNISLKNQANDQAMTYITLARSDRAGGINGAALAEAGDIVDADLKALLLSNSSFEPESLYSTEFGVKGHSLDNRLNLKLAAFYHYRDNTQLKSGITYLNDGGGTKFVDYTDNAGSSRGYGLEIETTYLMNDNIELYYNVGYLKTKIKDYVSPIKASAGLDMHNRQMAHAPKYTFNVGATYHADNGFYTSVELMGKDSFYYSDSHNEQSHSYALTNLSAGYQAANWRVNLSANNVFDKQYGVRGFLFGNDPRDFYASHNYEQFGAPRTVDLSLEVKW